MTFFALALSFALTVVGSAPDSRKPAPDFELKDLSGKRVKLSSLSPGANKIVIVDFWATWCAPCVAALPHLDKLQRDFADKGLTILAISTDGPQTMAQVRSLVKREKLSMPILLDPDGKVFAALNPRGTNPFTLIVDRTGKIFDSHEGYSTGDEAKYREWVEHLLKEDAKP